jgi:hypothetical protein
MVISKIKGLGGAIVEFAVIHPNFMFIAISIFHGAKPVQLPRLQWVDNHVGCRKCIHGTFQMCRGIIEAEDVGVIGVVLVKDIHGYLDLGENVVVCVISIASFSCFEKNTGTLRSVADFMKKYHAMLNTKAHLSGLASHPKSAETKSATISETPSPFAYGFAVSLKWTQQTFR